MTPAESEIERRIALLRTLPVIQENGWRPHVSCQWLGNGQVKIVSITIFAGRYHDKVMSVTRDADDVQEAIDKAFEYITKKLEEAYGERNTNKIAMG